MHDAMITSDRCFAAVPDACSQYGRSDASVRAAGNPQHRQAEELAMIGHRLLSANT
jgi:hypothetical protein